MGLKAIIEQSQAPQTVDSLEEDLRRLGVQPGMTLVVHSSLSSLDWVVGGAVAVILALQRCLGSDGTLVMPTHSTDLTDPRTWENPPVPQAWWVSINNINTNEHDFCQLGEVFERESSLVRIGQVGQTTSRSMPLRSCVDFAGDWLEADRQEP